MKVRAASAPRSLIWYLILAVILVAVAVALLSHPAAQTPPSPGETPANAASPVTQ